MKHGIEHLWATWNEVKDELGLAPKDEVTIEMLEAAVLHKLDCWREENPHLEILGVDYRSSGSLSWVELRVIYADHTIAKESQKIA